MTRHTNPRLRIAAAALLLTAAGAGCKKSPDAESENRGTYTLVRQQDGPTLGYAPRSGVKIIRKGRFLFKDLNRNGRLDEYEDWRNSPQVRAEALAAELSPEEIAGLMLYSPHQAVPTDSAGFWSSTYEGVALRESGLPRSALSDKQKRFLHENRLRAVLVVRVESPRIAAEWNNNLQAFVEGLDHGIPVNISSDPRNETRASAEYNAGAGGKISLWPSQLGLAATFDPALVEQFGRIASVEYRALGITTALSPQIDLATEPRWVRFSGTFGEDPDLAADLARAYVDGFQTSEGEAEITDGWGYESVNAMVKHWPGGGSGEGGRDAHFSYGKYAVYPGGNFEEHLRPFLEGAFRLRGKTGRAAAVMPYYTISWGADPSGKNVGNGFSSFLIQKLLREKYGYDGVVCTDWGITHDYARIEQSDGKCWGTETLDVDERHFLAIRAGVDQFGGNDDQKPVLAAWRKWAEAFGEQSARERFERSAVRLLLNSFRTGLFENPYVDPQRAEAVVGNPDFMKAGYEAQLRSIVLLKNRNGILPLPERSKVLLCGGRTAGNNPDPAVVSRYCKLAATPEEADFALVFIDEPDGGCGYDVEDRRHGGNGYVPISLQYGDYTARTARTQSIAGGDPLEKSANRSYRGKRVSTKNREEVNRVLEARRKMGDKAVVVVVNATRPFVPAEFEPAADVILLAFGVQHQAVLDILCGRAQPSGLLPMQLPADMQTVERQNEDCSRDMTCHTDTEGNTYDFAFGLDKNGIIRNRRVEKYR